MSTELTSDESRVTEAGVTEDYIKRVILELMESCLNLEGFKYNTTQYEDILSGFKNLEIEILMKNIAIYLNIYNRSCDKHTVVSAVIRCNSSILLELKKNCIGL